jgi:hypothetical protein
MEILMALTVENEEKETSSSSRNKRKGIIHEPYIIPEREISDVSDSSVASTPADSDIEEQLSIHHKLF